MPKEANEGTSDSGQSNVAEVASPEEKAAIAALENDDTSWEDGEEVESRFEAKDDDDSAATDDDDSDVEESEDDTESEDDADDADSEEEDDSESEDENDQDAEDSDEADADTTDADQEAAERKRYNDQMARERIARKKAEDEAARLRKEREQESIQQYLEDAGDDDNERARRENNVEQFRIQQERVSLNDDKLRTGIERAVVEIELFRTGSQAVKEELASALDDFEQKFLVLDNNGRPLQIKVDPATGKQADVVTYLQRKADSIKRIQGDNAETKARTKKKETVRTMTPPTRAPKKAKIDADLEAFDDEARK